MKLFVKSVLKDLCDKRKRISLRSHLASYHPGIKPKLRLSAVRSRKAAHVNRYSPGRAFARVSELNIESDRYKRRTVAVHSI